MSFNPTGPSFPHHPHHSQTQNHFHPSFSASSSSSFKSDRETPSNQPPPPPSSSSSATSTLVSSSNSVDYYEVLGISQNATEIEVREAFLRKARQLHPDKNLNSSTTEFTQLHDAYRVLSVPSSRLKYDRGFRPAQSHPLSPQDINDILVRVHANSDEPLSPFVPFSSPSFSFSFSSSVSPSLSHDAPFHLTPEPLPSMYMTPSAFSVPSHDQHRGRSAASFRGREEATASSHRPSDHAFQSTSSQPFNPFSLGSNEPRPPGRETQEIKRSSKPTTTSSSSSKSPTLSAFCLVPSSSSTEPEHNLAKRYLRTKATTETSSGLNHTPNQYGLRSFDPNDVSHSITKPSLSHPSPPRSPSRKTKSKHLQSNQTRQTALLPKPPPLASKRKVGETVVTSTISAFSIPVGGAGEALLPKADTMKPSFWHQKTTSDHNSSEPHSIDLHRSNFTGPVDRLLSSIQGNKLSPENILASVAKTFSDAHYSSFSLPGFPAKRTTSSSQEEYDDVEDEACVVADEDDEEDEDEGYKIQDRGIVIDANDDCEDQLDEETETALQLGCLTQMVRLPHHPSLSDPTKKTYPVEMQNTTTEDQKANIPVPQVKTESGVTADLRQQLAAFLGSTQKSTTNLNLSSTLLSCVPDKNEQKSAAPEQSKLTTGLLTINKSNVIEKANKLLSMKSALSSSGSLLIGSDTSVVVVSDLPRSSQLSSGQKTQETNDKIKVVRVVAKPAASSTLSSVGALRGNKRPENGNQQRQPKAHSLEITLGINFEEGIKGSKKKVLFQRSVLCEGCHGLRTTTHCPQCSSQGYVITDHQVIVSVPPGVQDQFVQIYQGEGDLVHTSDLLSQTLPGDLIVVIRVKQHPLFTRSSFDVHLNHPVSMTEAALGTCVEIPTIYGSSVELEIAPGIQPGFSIRLEGLGFPHPQEPSRKGDMIVTFTVKIPKQLTQRQRELLKEFEKLATDSGCE